MKNAFVSAGLSIPEETRTENGMKAQKSTMSHVVDLFYTIGSSRGRNITPLFERAYQADSDLALRIALWTRDARGGAGERQLFRDVLVHLEKYHVDVLLDTKFMSLIPELGRWDDMLVFKEDRVRAKAYAHILQALREGNGLCAKWMPRKGEDAIAMRKFFNWSPKQYRKTLVTLSDTVEQKMCAREFTRIEYSHVPSLAMSRYLSAFSKNDASRFVEFRNALVKGETKVNAGAVYPYDIVKAQSYSYHNTSRDVSDAQWDALPNYMNDQNVLPMVDVSGSMCCPAGRSGSVSCLDVSLSLGLYCADKNKGAFKDFFLTFSANPRLVQLKGKLSQKIAQMQKSDWGMNTNIIAAFKKILDVAKKGDVPQADMPTMLLILSDMQFDHCARFDHSAIQSVTHLYEEAGYKLPAIVFWNLNASKENVPVSFDKRGVALVSGFSPAIMKAVLAADLAEMTPESIVRSAVCVERYDYV